MKGSLEILAIVMVLTAASSTCLAVWDIELVSPQRAKELQIDVCAVASDATHVRIRLDFKPVKELKGYEGVEMIFDRERKLIVSAPLREDRSKSGHVVCEVTVDRTQLENLTFRISARPAPTAVGGVAYDLPVKDFVGQE